MNAIAGKFIFKQIQRAITGDTVTELDILPSDGIQTISVFCPVVMGHATIMTLTLSTADDAVATNTTALTEDVPVWLFNSTYPTGLRLADAKAGSVPAANFTAGVVDNWLVFQVPANLVPAGKYLGVHCNAGNALNIYDAIAFEDSYYNA